MNIQEENAKTWDTLAVAYQDKFMNLNLYNDTYDTFCNALSLQNPKVLEVGCGPGNITRYLIEKRPDFEITAIDIAPNMMELAQRNNPEANCIVMDSRDIVTLATKFDAIICGFCLPYLSSDDSTRLVENCGNLLLKDGILYLSFVEGEINQSGYQTTSAGNRVYFYYHNTEDILTALGSNGFRLMKNIGKAYTKNDGTNETHRIIIAASTK